MNELERYRRAVYPQVVTHRQRFPEEHYHDALNRLVCGTSCPIIVLAHYIGEFEGYTEELKAIIASFEEYYKEKK